VILAGLGSICRSPPADGISVPKASALSVLNFRVVKALGRLSLPILTGSDDEQHGFW